MNLQEKEPAFYGTEDGHAEDIFTEKDVKEVLGNNANAPHSHHSLGRSASERMDLIYRNLL